MSETAARAPTEGLLRTEANARTRAIASACASG